MVLRTFVQDVGTHAIAVGFPQQVHYVFDTMNGNLAVGWRGRFLDAQGTWYIRFSPPAAPLGEDVMSMPQGKLLDAEASNASYQFKGYRLDSQRIPTFLYSIDGHDIEDRILPDDKNGLRRTITIRKAANIGSSNTFWLRLNEGKSLVKKSESSFTNDRGLSVSLIAPPIDSGTIQEYANGERWSVPVAVDEDLSIEVVYSW